jgi:hypothetical protein
LVIATHDVTGKPGAPLPLEIKLIRVRNVYIEAVKLLGLPRGVTISDSNNMFSSSSDNNDVDVSGWDLSKIRITQSDERESSFSLAVAAIWTPESGGHIDVTSSRLNVHFLPDGRGRDRAASGDGRDRPERNADQIREAAAPPQAVATIASLDALASDIRVPEAPPIAPRDTITATDPPAPPALPDGKAGAEMARLPDPAPATPSPASDPLVERAKGLIRLGDISGARLLLERAQARNAPNATFLLAQTWDPAMLRAWKVRGLRADPDLARSLYAKAAAQDRPDGRQRAETDH